MFKLTLKELSARKRRLLGTGFAVLLGVAFMAGTFVFTSTLTSTFHSAIASADAGVDAQVRVPSTLSIGYGESAGSFDSSVAAAVRSTPGVQDVALEVSGYAQLVGPDGKTVGELSKAPAFGLNWVPVQALNPYRLASGHAPARDDEIVIDRGAAKTSGYGVGDVVTVLTKREPRRFTIAGTATFGSSDTPAGSTAVLFTTATASSLLAEPGRVDAIAVTAGPGVSQDSIAASLRRTVPADLEVITGRQLVHADQAAFDQQSDQIGLFMTIFAAVAVLVGAFIINNTFSITVAQRTRQLAMLRALGAGRRQLLASVLGEALVIGVVASAVGVLAGIGVANGLKALFTAVGLSLPPGPTVVHADLMVLAAAVGVVVTLTSAWLPARRAGRVLPVAALRETAVDSSAGSASRLVTGGILSTAGVASLLVGLGGAGVQLVGLGALVSFVGVAVLAPVLARPVTAVLGWPLRLGGLPAELATRNAGRSPKRTARTASSLMIGVALVAFIAVVSASMRTSFAGSLESRFRGTHVLDSGADYGGAGLSPALAASLASTPGVRAVTEARTSQALVGGSPTELSAFTPRSIGQMFDLGTVRGDLGSLGADGIAVDAEKAASAGWTLGSTVPVTFPGATATFHVRAIFDRSAEWVGDEFVGVGAFDALVPDTLDHRIYVDGTGAAVTAAAAAYPSATVLDRAGFVELTNAKIDQLLGIIYVLLALAVIIALLGIANTMALSIFERTRELGLLRAVGTSRSQVRRTIRWEAVIIAAFGTTLGLGVGTFFGWATVRALADKGITTLTIPVGTLALITAIAAGAGGVAALVPARRAARMNVLAAVATA
ncbi:MAG TPA: FtsX-like permease family protein [Acidimicrobiales bacterium]